MPTEKAKKGRRRQRSSRSASTTSSTEGARPAAEAAALDYLGRGWSVVAVKPGDKSPLLPWRDYQQRHPDRRTVESWFARWPDANVGIVTGQISNLVVLDIDPRHRGDASIAELTRRFGPLPPTLTAHTGGGGRHYYFAAPADPLPLRSRIGLAEGVDVRAEGGIVVAPPSVHPSGGRYTWLADRDACPAPLPRWLIGLIRGDNRRPGHGVGHWRKLATDGVREGERNDAIASFAGHLLRCGVDPEVVAELMLCWNRVRARPPLDDTEVARTVESIRRTALRHRQDTEY